jgi:hypothetical protein
LDSFIDSFCNLSYDGDVSVASRGQEKCISCVPRSLFRYNSCVLGSRGSVCYLRPAVSKRVYHYRGIKCLEYSLTQLSQLSDIIVLSKHNGMSHLKKGIVSVACHGVCFLCICCVPSGQQHAYELQRKLWVYKTSINLNVRFHS